MADTTSGQLMPAIDGEDGYALRSLFHDVAKGSGVTYDDIIFLPGFIDFDLNAVDLSSKFTQVCSSSSMACSAVPPSSSSSSMAPNPPHPDITPTGHHLEVTSCILLYGYCH